MFERGSVGAAVVLVVFLTVGCGAAVWYQGRLWHELPTMRFWHGALIGLLLGVALVVAGEWP